MRNLRKLRDGAQYHVTARINRSELLLLPEEDKKLLLAVIGRAKKRYRFQVKNFCIMNNHLHLLIKPYDDESLSRIMQWILSVFAMSWNRKHNIHGHVWGERFYSRIIEGIVDFLRTFIYIDDNPVNAQLINRSWEWRFGGLWHHKHGIKTVTDPPDILVLQYCPEHELAKKKLPQN
jgi:putative transposase